MSRADWRRCWTIIARTRMFGYLNCAMKQSLRFLVILRLNCSMICLLALVGCVREASVPPLSVGPPMILVSGRAMALITGDRGRRFEPEVRWLEFMHRQTGERYSATLEAGDKTFVLFLPAGHYEITRVQISEGPFRSIAQLSSSFCIGETSMIFVGTWRFGIDSPRYGRMVLVSMVAEDDTRQEIEQTIRMRYPALGSEILSTVIPSPAETETRLYEVLPYPRYPRYFQRHLW